MCNWIFLKPKRTTFFFTLVNDWTEQQTKIQAKFPGVHDGGPLAQCLFSVQQHVWGCSEQIAPDTIYPLKYVPWLRSFFTRLLPQKEKKETACDGKSGQLLCAITVALLRLQSLPVDIRFRNDRPPPAPGGSQSAQAAEEKLSTILTVLLMRNY